MADPAPLKSHLNIRFARSVGRYRKGETACFPMAEARAYIDKGLAEREADNPQPVDMRADDVARNRPKPSPALAAR